MILLRCLLVSKRRRIWSRNGCFGGGLSAGCARQLLFVYVAMQGSRAFCSVESGMRSVLVVGNRGTVSEVGEGVRLDMDPGARLWSARGSPGLGGWRCWEEEMQAVWESKALLIREY